LGLNSGSAAPQAGQEGWDGIIVSPLLWAMEAVAVRSGSAKTTGCSTGVERAGNAEYTTAKGYYNGSLDIFYKNLRRGKQCFFT